MNEALLLCDHRLPDGRQVVVRDLTAQDEPLIAAAVETASAETLRHRFLTPLHHLSRAQIHSLLVIDPQCERCVVGWLASPTGERIICGGRYVRLDDPAIAEIALTVHDEFQRMGLGRLLLRLLAGLALAAGVRRVVGDVLATNHNMLGLLRATAPAARLRLADGLYHFEWDLPAEASAPSGILEP